MKPALLIAADDSAHSFTVREDKLPVNNRWHYHAELELIYFTEGQGTRFIGDNVSRFSQREMYLIGAYLPHYWRIDDKYFGEHQTDNFNLSVVHFKENFWGDHFLKMPENKVIKKVLDMAGHGLRIEGKAKADILALIKRMQQTEGPKRIILMVEILLAIAESHEIATISRNIVRTDIKELEKKRINLIYDYAVTNMARVITLAEIAAVANLSPKSFCRYFKVHTHKTFSRFIMELKVGTACKLLIEGGMELKEICYECGFNNLAGFHKCFKNYTGKSPKQYQKSFMPDSKSTNQILPDVLYSNSL